MEDKKNFYIDGQWVSPLDSRTFEVINPANEEPCAEISLGGKKDVDAAVGAARKAFESWSFTPKNERLYIIYKSYRILIVSLLQKSKIKYYTEYFAENNKTLKRIGMDLWLDLFFEKITS